MKKKEREELCSVLRTHAQKYPLMAPIDAVKLIFQNEFGGGHLISTEEKCLEYLVSEYKKTPQNGGALTENIGRGIVRVKLSALDSYGITPKELCCAFVRSAEMIKGSVEGLREKLALLSELTELDTFAFNSRQLSDYLSEYEKAGYPAVSHSEEYRKAYRPAYRIVLAELLKTYIREE